MKWTPVTTSLPLKTGMYLVVVGWAQIQVANFNSNSAKWTIYDRDSLGNPNITHWMELPPLPKAK